MTYCSYVSIVDFEQVSAGWGWAKVKKIDNCHFHLDYNQFKYLSYLILKSTFHNWLIYSSLTFNIQYHWWEYKLQHFSLSSCNYFVSVKTTFQISLCLGFKDCTLFVRFSFWDFVESICLPNWRHIKWKWIAIFSSTSYCFISLQHWQLFRQYATNTSSATFTF